MTTIHRLYVAGPMSGYPDYNRPAFAAATEQLQAAGFIVYSPHTIRERDGWEWADYMREALKMMLGADAVALLPGWEASRGASIEQSLATELGMPARPLTEWLKQ